MKETKWENRALSELGSVSRGKSKHRPRNDKKLYGGDYPFIQTADVKNANFYINEFSQTYNEIGLKQSKLWEKDTLCITIAANIAETALLSFPACFPDSIVGFIPYENISDVRYVKYTLDNYKTEFQKRSKGATQDNLSVSKINSLKLLVPDYNYQVEVADVISQYDLLIENNQKRIRLLNEISQKLYDEWFVNFRFPEYEKTNLIDSELGKIPEGWQVKSMKQIADFINGYAFKPRDLGNDGYPIIKIPELRDGVTLSTPRNKGTDIKGKYHIHTGDLLFSWSATLLVNFWKDEESLLNQHLFKVDTSEKYKEYVYFLLIRMIERISKHTVGATMKHLRRDTILDYKIVVPSDAIIKQFSQLCSNIFSEIEIIYKSNKNIINSRGILIETLVTGKKHLYR